MALLLRTLPFLRLSLMLVFWTAFTNVWGQSWEAGLGLGGMIYKGDVAPNFSFRDIRPAANLILRRNLSHPVTLRLNIGAGNIASADSNINDPFQQARGVSFRSGIREASVLLEYNFLNYSNRRRDLNWTPYFFGGFGLQLAGLQNTIERSPMKKIHFPLGVGVKYEFKRPWSVGFEFGTRFTITDYLDGYGPQTFVKGQKLRNGDPSNKDKYTYLGVSLTYTFYNIACPEGRRVY